jgi:hypothetical protein
MENHKTNDLVAVLMRQTTYTKEECVEMLKNYTIEECIAIYLQIKKPPPKPSTTNQNIFKSIREFF